ncbi:hypothetical protein FIBSPDRAFT_883258 [Athelia psychrophila]|uniref:F-box domain-containing protein n=1 Tax=Athelia psychrophila TaxID=1759441 RepID=A0A166U9R6_9AGAM|nr:hypothetical protein FIBSPDRAFT_883258 [Fibularhizoctonia sp. CBS 109695]
MNTCAGKRSTLSSLPVEVLDAITQNASPFDQVSLCATSKLMNEVAMCQLYRNIRVTSPRQRVSTRTCHLMTLSLHFLPLDLEWCYILDDVFLPNLFELSLVAKSTSDLASFLNRHPDINKLQLLCQAHDCYLHMPALLSFSGLYFTVPNIAASSPFINQFIITWGDVTDEMYNDTLESLALSPVASMGCNVLPAFKNLHFLAFERCDSTDGASTRKTANRQWRKFGGFTSLWLPKGDLEETRSQEFEDALVETITAEEASVERT